MTRLFLFLLCCILPVSASAELSDSDRIRQGLAAFNAKDYDKAEELLLPIEKTQPSAAYLLKWVAAMQKKQGRQTNDKKKIARLVLEGDNAKLDRLGMIIRASAKGRTTGLAAGMEKNRLLSSAKTKNTASAYRLGLFYQEGIGFPRDFGSSAKFFKIAADNGNAAAANTLGLYHRFGLGVERNFEKAREYYEKALLKKDMYALYNLADMLNDASGERRDVLQAHILSDMALQKLKAQKKKEKKKIFAAEYLKKETEKALTPLQKAYLKKFLPFWLSPLISEKYLNGRMYPKKLPLPPRNGQMIEKTAFMSRVNADPEAYKFKTLPPLMPNWIPFDSKSPADPALKGKTPPFPYADSNEMISALYYRQAVPQRIKMTLGTREIALPLIVGDIVTLYAYSPLHETETTLKGGKKNFKNTGYQVLLNTPVGTMDTDSVPLFLPLSDETKETESWVGQAFQALAPGKAVVRFTPRNEAPDAFGHTVVFIISPAPEL